MPSKAILAWTLGLAVFALLLANSQPFHSCIQEVDKYYRGNASQEGISDILIVLKTFKSCIGVYILEKNAVITAFATIAIAAFTGTIWAINKSQLAHGQKVERAYISGGGGYLLDTRTNPKTQGTVTAYAVFVIDRANLPPEPAYLTPGFVPTPFGGIYQLGGPTLPITQVTVPPGPNPIAYGRLWYSDIFGGEHHFSFALPIRTPDNHAILIGINPAYTEST